MSQRELAAQQRTDASYSHYGEAQKTRSRT
jgi:hypothetical protein